MPTPEDLLEVLFTPLDMLGELWTTFMLWLVAAAMHGSFLTPGTNPDGPAQAEALAARYQPDPDAENGWPALLRLRDAVRETSWAFYEAELARLNGGREARGQPLLTRESPELVFSGGEAADPSASPEFRDAARRLAQAHAAAGTPELQEALLPFRRFVRPIPQGPLKDAPLEEIGCVRSCVRLGVTCMFVAHEAGDDAGMARAYARTIAVTNPFSIQWTPIDHLVVVSAHMAVNRELRCELAERPPGAEALRALIASFDSAIWPDAERMLAGERLQMLDTAAYVHTDDGAGDGWLIFAELDRITGGDSLVASMARKNPVALWLLARQARTTKRQAVAEAERFFSDAARWVALPPRERADSPLHPRHALADAKERWVLFIGIMAPPVERLARTFDIAAIDRAGTRTMLALELFNAEHGRYPDSLAELVPAYLPALPEDPFSPGGLRYRRLDPASDAGTRPYLLYSVGFDGLDNGGRPHPDGPNAALFTDSRAGFDYVLNRSR